MKIRELIAILDRREMGRVFRDMKGRVSFVYDEKWRNAADAFPLSLTMPLTRSNSGLPTCMAVVSHRSDPQNYWTNFPCDFTMGKIRDPARAEPLFRTPATTKFVARSFVFQKQ